MGTVLGLLLLIGGAWALLSVLVSLTVGKSISSAEDERKRQERQRQRKHGPTPTLPR